MSRLIHSKRSGLHSEAEVLDWAHRSLGPLDVIDDVSSPHSTQRVLHCETRSNDAVIVKWFVDSPCFFNSLDTLTNYSVALGGSAPRLIDQNETLRALVMTHVPGHSANKDQSLDPTIHFTLGTLLRQFHDSAPTNRSTEIAAQLASTLSTHIDSAEALIGETLASEARQLAMQLLDLESISLMPTHGAISPEHILIDPDRGVHLIGFSRSEYNPWILDTAILERNLWTYSPELRSAFFTGYDKEPDSSDLLVLRAIQLIDACKEWLEVSARRVSKSELARSTQQIESALGGTLF
ncbi:MAG: phosphotransferase [Aquiluna sp.]